MALLSMDMNICVSTDDKSPENIATKIVTIHHRNNKSGTIWLSGFSPSMHEKFLKKYNISKIVKCIEDSKDSKDHESIKYLKISMQDNSRYNITQHFDDIIAFIKESTTNGENVLIHCKSGISRSAAVMIMYYLTLGYDITKSFVKVKRARPWINPIQSFIEQLIVWHYGKRKLKRVLEKYNSIKHKECDRIPKIQLTSLSE